MPDGVRSHYTGKERDTESGLDYFGARYYASSMGRFSNPDPSQLYYADLSNPQSFNLYSYVQNNPLKNVDPTGLDCVYLNASGDGIDENGIDHNSDSAQCGSTGGYWAPGNVSGGSSITTSDKTDAIRIASTVNSQDVHSVANCAGCSTLNANGSLIGAATQTFGNVNLGYPLIGYGSDSGLPQQRPPIYQGPLHLAQQPPSPSYSIWGTLKGMANCYAMDSPTPHIGPKPSAPHSPTDTVENQAADLSVYGKKSGRQLSPNIGMSGAAESEGTSADAAAMAADISNCVGGK